MLDSHAITEVATGVPMTAGAEFRMPQASSGIADLVAGLAPRRRILHARQHVFRAGQPQRSLWLIHSGVFKTSLVAPDGREKITGFRMRGDLLGLDSLGLPVHGCDATSLDVGEVWELPCALLREQPAAFQDQLTATLAGEIRRDWNWMLAVGTLTAEQRVVAFLLDLAGRLAQLGFSPRQLTLRMTRTDIGNFLSLKLETVVRALSRLQALGLIVIDGREIRIRDRDGLQDIVDGERLAA
jgi:CRP/FNR family transcriptional regulator, anaerobic regulatory protein